VIEHIQRHDKSAVVFLGIYGKWPDAVIATGVFTEIWNYQEIEIVVEAGKERIRLAW